MLCSLETFATRPVTFFNRVMLDSTRWLPDLQHVFVPVLPWPTESVENSFKPNYMGQASTSLTFFHRRATFFLTPLLYSPLLSRCPFFFALSFLVSLCSNYWIKAALHHQSAKTHTQDIQHSSVIKRPEVQKLLHGALLYHWGQQ